MYKKIFSLLLAVIVVIGILPLSAFAAEAWTYKATANMDVTNHASIAYNGKIYIFGGVNAGRERLTQIYDIASNTFSLGANMPFAISDHSAVLYDGKVYVIGGTVTGGSCNYSMGIYDIASDTWVSTTGVGKSRMGFVEHNGVLYAIGGNNNGYQKTVSAYDIAAGAWTNKYSLSYQRAGMYAVVYNDKIYAIGGNGDMAGEIYDFSTNKWTNTANHTSIAGRIGHTGILCNGKIYIMGGTTNSNTTYIYDIASNTWTQGANMPTARRNHAAVLYDGKIYLTGGTTTSSTTSATNIFDIYDIATDTWSQGANTTTKRYSHTMDLYGNTLYMFGGNNNSNISYLKTMEAYTLHRITGNITVTVEDSYGNKVSGASVTGSFTGTTDSNGCVTFEDKAFNTYGFAAAKTGYASGTGSATISSADPDQNITITLNELIYNFGVNVTHNSTGAAISGVSVKLTGTSIAGTAVNKTVSTNVSGIASFTDIPYGTSYTLTATKMGLRDNVSTISVTSNESKNISLTPTQGNVKFTVKDGSNGNANLAGATVELKWNDGEIKYTTTTDENGVANFPMDFGIYKAEVYAPNYDRWIMTSESIYIMNDGDNYSKTVTLYKTPPTEGSLTIIVKNKNAQPISGAKITIKKENEI